MDDSRATPRVNFSKIAASCPGAMPGPRSCTVTASSPAATAASIVTGEPAGVYLPAFSSRLKSTRSMSTPSMFTSGASGAMVTVMARGPSAGRADAMALPITSSIGCQLRRRCVSPASMRAMSSRLATSEARRCDWRTIACTLSCCAGESAGSLAASDCASPTSDVSGVRRSCDRAASSELRRRSVSMRRSACCATAT